MSVIVGDFFKQANPKLDDQRELLEKSKNHLGLTHKYLANISPIDDNELYTLLSGLKDCIRRYVAMHEDTIGEYIIRDDHWDKLNKKLVEDSSAKELWEQILILMKLEE